MEKNATEQIGSPNRSQTSHDSDKRCGGTKGPEKQEPGHHWHKIKGIETRLNQISLINTKAVVGEKSIETIERP